ncbi:hypothetical protein M427DRAFT_62563, partial [Gonapodya prolifera JEL478]
MMRRVGIARFSASEHFLVALFQRWIACCPKVVEAYLGQDHDSPPQAVQRWKKLVLVEKLI